MIAALSNVLEQRKIKLTSYLKNNTDSLSIEKQHQVYGAIKELEAITDIIKAHKHR